MIFFVDFIYPNPLATLPSCRSVWPLSDNLPINLYMSTKATYSRFFLVYLFYVLILEIFAWNLVPSFNIFHSISNLIIDIQTSKFWSHTICIILGKFYRKISLKILTLKSRSIFHFHRDTNIYFPRQTGCRNVFPCLVPQIKLEVTWCYQINADSEILSAAQYDRGTKSWFLITSA